MNITLSQRLASDALMRHHSRMQQNNKKPPLGFPAMLGRFAAIGAILISAAAIFAFTAGWFSPDRRTQERMMTAFEAHDGKHPGFRRNHAKGVCVTGWFDASADASWSRVALFHLQRVPIVGRFALAGGMPFAADDSAQVRSMALRFMPLGAQEWRTGMNDIPVFAVNSSDGFYDLLKATTPDAESHRPDPEAMEAFLVRHPEAASAMQLIKARSISSGFADDTYNSLNTFFMTGPGGETVPVRWAAIAMQPFVADERAAHAGAGKNYLFDELLRQLDLHALKWRLVFTMGEAGDPTADASLPWPKERRQVVAGVITIARAMNEDSGACNDVNYDPMVLPDGISPSDDPLLAARASAYARSFTLRSGEKSQKPASAVAPKNIGGLAP